MTSPRRRPPGRDGWQALSALLAGLSVACAGADDGARPAPPLPEAALTRYAPDSVRVVPLSRGVHYRYLWSPSGPWAIHMVSADLAQCQLDLRVIPALADDGVTRIRKAISEMRPSGEVEVIAGVNGDFFAADGTPVGPEVTGSTRRVSARPALSWGRDRMLRIGPADTEAATVGAALQVIGGFPELLDGGSPVGDLGVAERPSFAGARHPRTAVGLDVQRALLWIVVVDGRQIRRLPVVGFGRAHELGDGDAEVFREALDLGCRRRRLEVVDYSRLDAIFLY